MEQIRHFFHKPFFTDHRTLFALWLLLPIFIFLKTYFHGVPDNTYDIFRYVYEHTFRGVTLYGEYPGEYTDENHYGPFFSIFVAPFAVLPLWVGYALWLVAMTMILYFAIRVSGFSRQRQIFILWFCAVEMLNCIFQAQFNGVIAGVILLSYVLVEKEHDEWATLAMLVGTFIKLYGIVGLAFFFFSRHKTKFIVSFIVWSVVLFCLPMLISSPQYVVSQYVDWYESLSVKNQLNITSWDQNISLLGIVRRWSGCQTYSDLWVIIPGLLLFAATYFRVSQWKHVTFRETVCASVMMFVTLFSTGTESYGHIISMLGVAIWYTAAPWQRSRWDIALLVFAFILTSMSPSDLFPAYLRKTYVIPYSLKALPITIIWFKLCHEMLTKDYAATTQKLKSSKT